MIDYLIWILRLKDFGKELLKIKMIVGLLMVLLPMVDMVNLEISIKNGKLIVGLGIILLVKFQKEKSLTICVEILVVVILNILSQFFILKM